MNRNRDLIRQRINDEATYTPSSVAPTSPQMILFEVSNLCNHNCVFCAYPKMDRPTHRLDLALGERLLREAYDLGVREAGFYSGTEPFTSPDLEKLVRLAKQIGYSYTFVTTNGSLATRPRLKELIDCGLDSLKFSINGADAESYREIHGQDHFHRVIEHLKFADEYRKATSSSMYLAVSFVEVVAGAASNVGTSEKLRELLSGHIDEFIVYEANNEGGYMIGLAPMSTMGVTAPCAYPFTRVTVSAEGYLRLCCSDYQNYLSVADLNHVSLIEAWNAEGYQAIRRRHLANELEGALCYNCINNINTPIEPLTPALAVKVEKEFFLLEVKRAVKK